MVEETLKRACRKICFVPHRFWGRAKIRKQLKMTIFAAFKSILSK
jgi:hypothetical protein